MQIVIYPFVTPVVGHIFNFPVRYYGLIMALAFFVGIFISYILFNKKYSKIEADIAFDYLPLLILFSILGARIFYIVGSFDYYIHNLKEIIMINHGGLSIFGAILFGIITLFLLSKKNKFNFLVHLDILATVMPICQAIGRFGNYFNQEAYGLPSNSFIKLYVDSKYRYEKYFDVEFYHPTFLYESILDIFIFGILLILIFKMKNLKNGSIALIYLILYSFVRFFIEQIRIDSVMYVFNMPVAQFISLIVFIFSLIVLFLLNKKASN